jgi:ATP-dependent DNA helicase DinG
MKIAVLLEACQLVIEVEVHKSLRTFLRASGEPYWPHHLTMARLVARALRLGRSALIQTGIPPGCSYGRYRLSYLMPVLLWPDSVIIVATEAVQQRLLMVEIPQLQQWLQQSKAIRSGQVWPHENFQGIFLTTPQAWLGDRLNGMAHFPSGIPTLIDGADDLEEWAHQQLTVTLEPADWNELMLAYPQHAETIRDVRVQLTRSIYQHPANPYECYLIDTSEQNILGYLFEQLFAEERSLEDPHPTCPLNSGLPKSWYQFWQGLQQPNSLIWANILRSQGLFTLSTGPLEVASALSSVWSQQPLVLMGGTLDLETEASTYRQRLGLSDLTCIKFSPDRQNELIQLYVPDRLPLPNTPQFQSALLKELRVLLGISAGQGGLTVLLIEDVPLKAQIGAELAGEFGSRVQVEKTCLDDNGVLVTGWEFWHRHQQVLPAPQLLVIATLPIPSLENPIVAGRVAYYKQQRQDWFRLYLLPVALSELQRAIAPLRESQGVVALLDSRVLHRSYGHQVLEALSPLARIDYLDVGWFASQNYSV